LEETERGYSPLSAQGRPASQPDQAQAIERSTRYQYGRVNGRSVLVAVDGPLPGTGDTVKLSWDRRGDHVQAMLGPLGQHHRWTQRDESGRVVEEVPSDGVIVRHRYLPSGMPAQWTRGPAQARVQFDALNRPVRIELPDGEVQSLRHGGSGDGVALANNRGQMRWVVPPDRPVRQVDRMAGVDSLVRPQGGGGALRSSTPPQRGPWPDSHGWVDDFGRLVALSTQDTGLETRQYDEGNRLVRRSLADGSNWRWQRDVRGRILAHTTERPGSPALRTTLRYEGERLVQIEHPHEQERLSYDQWGRLSQRTLSRGPLGKQRFKATEHYKYDDADRLTTWQLPEGGSLHYEWGVG